MSQNLTDSTNPKDNMAVIKLERSGNAPLKFEGALIAESSGRWQFSHEHNRWHDLAVYRTAKGQYVAHIRYNTQWQGEAHYAQADIVADAQAAVEYFKSYDPLSRVAGFPTGEAYAGKNARLRGDVSGRYAAQVSDILDADEFAQDVE